MRDATVKDLLADLADPAWGKRVPPYVAVDTETYGPTRPWDPTDKNFVDALTARCSCVTMSWFCPRDGQNNRLFLPVNILGADNSDVTGVMALLRGHATVVMHNSNYDVQAVLNTTGIDLSTGRVYDTMVLARVLSRGAPDPNPKLATIGKQLFGLKAMVKHHLGRSMQEFPVMKVQCGGPSEEEVESAVMQFRREIIATKKDTGKWLKKDGKSLTQYEKQLRKHQVFRELQTHEMPVETLREYALDDAVQTLRLLMHLRKLCSKREWAYFVDVEMPSVHVAGEMYRNGMPVDTERLDLIREKALPVKEALEKTWTDLTGTNILSAKQVPAYLYGGDSPVWPPDVYTPRTPSKTYSTGAEAVLWAKRKFSEGSYARRLADLKAEHADVNKIVTTYTLGLKAEIPYRADCRLHPAINVIGTDTGRWSVSRLHQIPRPKGVLSVRSAFSVKAGKVFVKGDFSQLEVVIMTVMSGDEALRRVILEGLSMHDITAEALGIPRDQAKVVNFLKNYGGGAKKLALALKMELRERGGQLIAPAKAIEYAETYDRTYAGVTAFRESMTEFCRKHGYVETWYGRRRYLPDIYQRNTGKRYHAERQASNHPIQGTAGDIVKRASADISRRWYGKKDRVLLMQVHDELDAECDAEVVGEVVSELREAMEGATPKEWSLPLKADVKTGANWAECK